MKTIIGKTTTGKSILDKVRHPSHASFTMEEHREAASLNHMIYDRAMKMLDVKRGEVPGFTSSQEAFDFIQTHHALMVGHTRRANDLDKKVVGAPKIKIGTLSRDEVVGLINSLRKDGNHIEAKRLYKELNKGI